MKRITLITLLSNLQEGDKFYFVEENGKLKNTIPYYVEGQYPKFHCTTVCALHNIKPCSFGKERHITMITAVENIQWVQVIQKQAIHICHKVTPLQNQQKGNLYEGKSDLFLNTERDEEFADAFK